MLNVHRLSWSKKSLPPRKKIHDPLNMMEGLSEEDPNKSPKYYFEKGEEAHEIGEQGKEASTTLKLHEETRKKELEKAYACYEE